MPNLFTTDMPFVFIQAINKCSLYLHLLICYNIRLAEDNIFNIGLAEDNLLQYKFERIVAG